MPSRILSLLIAFALLPLGVSAGEPDPPPGGEGLFEINQRLEEVGEPDESGSAAVVELGEGPAFPIAPSDDWRLPEEEASAVARPKAAPVPTLDPEFSSRDLDADAEPERVPVARPAPRKTTDPQDPETLSRIAPFNEVDEVEDTHEPIPTAAPKKATEKPASSADAPRYESGVGLDSDAAEALAEMLLNAEKGGGETPQPKSANQAKAPPELSEEMKARVAAAASAKKNTATPKAEKNKKPPAERDPEAELNDIIAEIDAKNKAIAEAKSKDEASIPAAPEQELIKTRDPRAARAIAALSKETPLGTVTVRVMDATAAALVPARVRIADTTDIPAEAPLSLGTWCEGTLRASVISGPVRIEVSRGRFHPIHLKGFEAAPGVNSAYDAVVARPRAMDFASRGWYLADLDFALGVQPVERSVWLGNSPSLDDLALAARAESVNVVGVNVPEDVDAAAFTESLAKLSSPELLLLPVFSGPRHGFYGTCMGLGVQSWEGLPREIVSPEKPLCDIMDEIRARHGLAVYKNLFGTKTVSVKRDLLPLFPRLQESGLYASGGNIRLYAAHELPFDTIINAYDVLAFDGSDDAEKLWFNLLKQGYPVSIIGSSSGSLEGGRPPSGQTFVQVNGKLTREAVLDAIRSGRTGVSYGPAVFAKIVERDMGPGSILPADGRPLSLQIQAYATMRQAAQIEKIEIIRNGVVVQTHHASEGEAQIPDFRCPISETSSAWYVVRVTERTGVNPVEIRRSRAWTSPIFFRGPSFAAPAVAQSRVTGVLRHGMTPAKGTVTAMVPGSDPIKVETDKEGRYKIEAPASATLVFAADGCEPYSIRIFSHPRVQRALAAIQTDRDGTLAQQFAKPALFASWNLLLSDLEWDVALVPLSSR